MGEVFLAHDEVLDRDVAVKFISTVDPDVEERKRFLVEARAIARLQHPNVVTVYRVGEVQGCPYLVSEFVRGESLDRLPRPVPWPKALEIGLGISRGLAAAHRRGVVHRDIKPANAILGDDGEVKLLDFGIAKLLQQDTASPRNSLSGRVSLSGRNSLRARSSLRARTSLRASLPEAAIAPLAVPLAVQISMPAGPLRSSTEETTCAAVVDDSALRQAHSELDLTRPGVVLGSPSYMAPELWLGEPATFRSDVYSLGALLYALCCGHPPHSAASLVDLREEVICTPAPPLVEVADGVDPAFGAIVDRCLARDPAARYASGNEVRAAFAQLTPEARAKWTPEGNPYRGLQAFEAEHQALYFGRDSEMRTILERLGSDPFLLVAGDSGVGKSSLCRAGVLPRIAGWLDPRRKWTSLIVVPGRNPLQAMAAALAPVVDCSAEELIQEISENPGETARAVSGALGNDLGLVLLVDPLEEMLTLADPTEAELTADFLGWLASPSPPLRLLATVRGDFLSRLAAFPHLGEEIPRALYFLRPLTTDRLREVITGPAAVKGVAFESDAVVQELIDAAVSAEGSLPLLQFAMAELWEAKGPEAKVLTAAHLEAIGGVTGALSRHADDVLARMMPAAKDAARRVMLRLVTAEGTRAHRSDEELGADDATTRKAIDALVAGRLVVARDTPDGAGYQLAHETLIRGWSTLAGWIANDAGSRLVRERLHLAVAEWERMGRAREALWSARQAEEAMGIDPEQLSSRERAFLLASRRARLRKLAIWIAVLLAVPVAAASVWGGMASRARAEKRARVDEEVAQASAAALAAKGKQRTWLELQERAFAQFDAQDRASAEATWKQALAAAADLKPALGQATQHLETALLLDASRGDVRNALADMLYGRAVLAEQLRSPSEQQDLLQRLKVYDSGGARAQAWQTPATVTWSATPAGAKVELARFAEDRGKLRREPLAPQPSQPAMLAPGSYCAIVSAPDHATTVLPFVVHRGDQVRLSVTLPRSREVPQGFVYVPAGTFLFGSAAEDRVRQDFFHTVPEHARSSDGFLIAQHETTFADWIEYLKAQPARDRPSRLPHLGKGGFQGALQLEERPDGSWRLAMQPTVRAFTAGWGEPVVYPTRARRASQDWRRFPVVGISVEDAERYVSWLDQSGKVPGARLCTELEWEKAARGSDGREFPHGAVLEPEDANYDDTYGKVPADMGPDEVGSHPLSRSPFGVDDMAGNVWEWTRSSLAPKEYAARGGGWYFGLNSARTTDREVTEPSFRDGTVGLRVCASLPTR